MGDKTKTAKKKHPILTSLGVLIVFLFVLLLAAIVFPAPILRYAFSRVEAETDIVFTFDRAYFYLADGPFLVVDGLSIKRQNHPASNFNLRADTVQMPTMVPKDFTSPVLFITGLRGTCERVGIESTDKNESASEERFFLQMIYLRDAEVGFIDRTLEKPFQTMVKIDEFCTMRALRPVLFEPYICTAAGQVSTAKVDVRLPENGSQEIDFSEVPLGLFAPYAPVLNDIFAEGSMNIRIDDLTDKTHKKLRVKITLLPDCEIKPANEILAPVIQEALQALDHSSVPALHDLKGKIDRLKTVSTSLRSKVDKAAPIVGAVLAIAAPNAKEEYEKIKSQYDQITNAYDEWNGKFEMLAHDMDNIKVGIVNDTFRYFVDSGIPIEVELLEVDGEWQCDWYETAIQLIEKHYRTLIAGQYQKRIQEIQESVDRLLAP